MKHSVIRTTLTESHLQNMRNKQLYLIISYLSDFIQVSLCINITHLYDIHKGEIIQSLCPAIVVSFREIISYLCIVFC